MTKLIFEVYRKVYKEIIGSCQYVVTILAPFVQPLHPFYSTDNIQGVLLMIDHEF